MIERQTKVPWAHYSFRKGHDSPERFISYLRQIDLTKGLGVEKVLEVGIGNKTVSNYLKQWGFMVTTCDYDESLQPDIVADIRELPMGENSFDVVLACEVLEHLPWEDVSTALSELRRVTRKYVIVSVPYSSLSLEIIFSSQVISKIFKVPCWDLFFRVPMFFRGFKPRGHGKHCWEMGRRNYSIRKVRKALREKFDIVKESRSLLSSNLNHYFFVLERRTAT